MFYEFCPTVPAVAIEVLKVYMQSNLEPMGITNLDPVVRAFMYAHMHVPAPWPGSCHDVRRGMVGIAPPDKGDKSLAVQVWVTPSCVLVVLYSNG